MKIYRFPLRYTSGCFCSYMPRKSVFRRKTKTMTVLGSQNRFERVTAFESVSNRLKIHVRVVLFLYISKQIVHGADLLSREDGDLLKRSHASAVRLDITRIIIYKWFLKDRLLLIVHIYYIHFCKCSLPNRLFCSMSTRPSEKSKTRNDMVGYKTCKKLPCLRTGCPRIVTRSQSV